MDQEGLVKKKIQMVKKVQNELSSRDSKTNFTCFTVLSLAYDFSQYEHFNWRYQSNKTVAKCAVNKEERLNLVMGTSVFIDFHLSKINFKKLGSQLEPPVTYWSDWSGHLFF